MPLTDHPDNHQQAVVATLFELGREVTSVLDLDELLHRIPGLIARLTTFTVFAVYLLNEREQELRIAYSQGYPEEVARTIRLKLGEGIVGIAVAEKRPILVNDLHDEPRSLRAVPGVKAQLAVPLRHQKRVIGALNLLSDRAGAFTQTDEDVLAQFAVHVAQAIVNARLFEQEREHNATLETLTETAREVAAILDLEELFSRIATLARRVVDYRTFGVLLVDEATNQLEPKVAIQYGEKASMLNIGVGDGLVGYAALHKEVVLVDDVAKDARYIPIVDDVRSELVVPLLLKDRCIGVFDLESPELAAFTKRHVEVLSILASQTAIAIENARLYETVRSSEQRLEQEIEFGRRVQMAILPTAPPKVRGVEIGARFEPARQIGGDLYDFLSPDANTLVVAVGDVSGKGVPAALYSAFAGELVRSRTFRRRYTTVRSSPAGVLASMNTILHERQLGGYFCALCYALFDFKRRQLTLANSGLPYPVQRSHAAAAAAIEMPGVPLGALPDIQYEERSFDLAAGDLYLFCTDGISEAANSADEEFGEERLTEVVERMHDAPAQAIVNGIFDAVAAFRGDGPAVDDMTAVAVKITR